MDTAKVEKKGQDQFLNLPKEFQFQGNEVYIKRIGRVVILIPTEDPWEPFISSWSQFSDDFMAERDQTAPQKRETF